MEVLHWGYNYMKSIHHVTYSLTLVVLTCLFAAKSKSGIQLPLRAN